MTSQNPYLAHLRAQIAKAEKIGIAEFFVAWYHGHKPDRAEASLDVLTEQGHQVTPIELETAPAGGLMFKVSVARSAA